LDHEHHEMNETREAAGAAMYQAVSRLAGFIASGRAEDSPLVHKKIHIVNFFVNKVKKYQAAAGEAGVQVWYQDGTGRTA